MTEKDGSTMATQSMMPDPSDAGEVDRYASRIMDMIRADMTEGFEWGDKLPAGLTDFSQLHDYCDANDYVTEAKVPYPTDGSGNFAFVNAVTSEVSRRMLEAATVRGYRCPCCGDDVVSTGPVCKNCQAAECEVTTDACGDADYWRCQRDV